MVKERAALLKAPSCACPGPWGLVTLCLWPCRTERGQQQQAVKCGHSATVSLLQEGC